LGQAELVCENLTKFYGDSGSQLALDSISFSIPSRGIFALIGKNGAGKTTLVRILGTQLEPTSGRASIDGLDVMKDARKLRSKIAMIPQEARTIPWMTPLQTVSSYLLWRDVPYREAKTRAAEALSKTGAAEFQTKLNRKLSGGQRRKVLVASVLAAEAEVTFLDEPTTGLDPISRRELWKSLHEIARNRFLILTTHYLEEAENLADTIGILDRGRLLAIGSLDHLRSLVKYQYSLRVPSGSKLPRAIDGQTVVGQDGQTQILTGESQAYELSKELLEQGTRFSVNRISLDDIFFHFVHSSAEGEA